MNTHAITKLDYNSAIAQYGAALTTPTINDFIVINEASASSLVDSSAPVVPRKAITVSKISQVTAQSIRATRIYTFYEDGNSCPASGVDDLPIKDLAKSARDRIAESDDLFRRMK
jgi:hypothetical protein